MPTVAPKNKPPWNKDAIEKAFEEMNASELVGYMKKVVIYLDNAWSELANAINNNSKVFVTSKIADISTASSAWAIAPVAGRITGIWTVINGVIAGGDATITPKMGGSAITGGEITIAYSGSAAGDVDSSTPTDGNQVAVGDAIEIASDGGSTNSVSAEVLIEITQ